VLLEHALRRDVVDERPSLEPVQAEVAEGACDGVVDGCRRDALPLPLLCEPVAEIRAPERPTDDVPTESVPTRSTSRSIPKR